MPPEQVTIAPIIPRPVVTPTVVVTDAPPPEPFTSWCEWAQDGLRNAMDGMKKAGGGVTEYHIGSRGLHRGGPADQIKNVDYWNEMVKLYCGTAGLPASLTGRDSACRIVPRDL